MAARAVAVTGAAMQVAVRAVAVLVAALKKKNT